MPLFGYKPRIGAKKPQPSLKRIAGQQIGWKSKMRKRLLLTAVVVLIVAISVPVALAAVQQKQIANVTESDAKPTPTPAPTQASTPSVTPAPIATAAPTQVAPTSQPPEASMVKYSLLYPNGTTFNLHQENAAPVFGATGLAVNGVPVNVQSGLGAPPMGYNSGVIVVKNDGNVPFSVNATLANVTVPAGVSLTSTSRAVNPSVYGSQVDGWMGRDMLATGSIVGAGQYAWLSVQVTMTNSTGNMGAIHTQDPIPYSFDVAVTATPT
jgi:cytoskeletal protein RodZ